VIVLASPMRLGGIPDPHGKEVADALTPRATRAYVSRYWAELAALMPRATPGELHGLWDRALRSVALKGLSRSDVQEIAPLLHRVVGAAG
jgi:hypothetical protein